LELGSCFLTGNDKEKGLNGDEEAKRKRERERKKRREKARGGRREREREGETKRREKEAPKESRKKGRRNYVLRNVNRLYSTMSQSHPQAGCEFKILSLSFNVCCLSFSL